MTTGVYKRTEYHKSCLRSWNKGLTKETDERVKKNAEAIKEALSNIPEDTREKLRESGRKNVKFAEGWNLGLTKETDPRVAKNAENISISWNNKSEEELKIFGEKISKIKTGISLSPEHKAKIGRKGERRSPKSEFKKGIRSCIEYEFQKGLVPWNKDKHGYFSEEVLEKLRNLPSYPGSGYGKGAWYYTSCQGYKWLRSSYEIAFAEYLDQNNILWYYEPKTFSMIINSKKTVYIPDFFLPEFNKFIEVKGHLDEVHKIKIQKFYEDNSYYLELLFRQDLLNLGINLKYYEKNKTKKYKNDEEDIYEYSLSKLFEEIK